MGSILGLFYSLPIHGWAPLASLSVYEGALHASTLSTLKVVLLMSLSKGPPRISVAILCWNRPPYFLFLTRRIWVRPKMITIYLFYIAQRYTCHSFFWRKAYMPKRQGNTLLLEIRCGIHVKSNEVFDICNLFLRTLMNAKTTTQVELDQVNLSVHLCADTVAPIGEFFSSTDEGEVE